MSQEPFGDAPGTARRRSLGILAAGVVLTPALVTWRTRPAAAQARTAYDAIASARAVSIFAAAIKNHGLENEFRAQGRFGFFVPLDRAADRLPALQLRRLEQDKEYARQVILNHITGFAEPISPFTDTQEGSWDVRRVRTKAGNTVNLATGGGAPRIGGYPITYANVSVSNGYCHAIDGVLLI